MKVVNAALIGTCLLNSTWHERSALNIDSPVSIDKLCVLHARMREKAVVFRKAVEKERLSIIDNHQPGICLSFAAYLSQAPSLGPPTRYYLMSRGLLDMGLNVGKNEGPIRDKGRFRNIRFSSVL